jgi:hypothetical protein
MDFTMIKGPPEILSRFDARLTREPIPAPIRSFYQRWIQFYFDFCSKYQHDAFSQKSLSPFLAKLAEKKQPSQLRKQAAHAISFFYDDIPQLLFRRPRMANRICITASLPFLP